MNLKNKTVLITGATGSLGKVLIEKFAEEKANIILHYFTNETKAKTLQQLLISKYNVKCLTVKADITNEKEVNQMIQNIMKEFTCIDILINNVGISDDDDFFTKDISTAKRILEVNAIGTYLVSREIGSIMLNQKHGNILNIASNNGIDSNYIESVDYDMSKASMISLTHNLAKALAPYIRVNAIAPGWIDTKITENLNPEFRTQEENKCLLNRFASKEEIANVVLFLTSNLASYINDSIIKVDGGIK